MSCVGTAPPVPESDREDLNLCHKSRGLPASRPMTGRRRLATVEPVPSGRSRPRVIPPRPFRAAFGMLSFVALLYGIELVNDLDPAAHLTDNGILPRTVDGLDGVLWAPLLHANWPHLMANTVPILV